VQAENFGSVKTQRPHREPILLPVRREPRVPTYGVSGLFGDPKGVRVHGRDERMLVRSFYEGQEFL
jgi:hypothetical protein